MAVMRDVFEEHEVRKIIDAATTRYRRLEDAYEGLKWRLSHEPQNGVLIPGYSSPRFLYKIDPPNEELPIILALYEFDGNRATILSLRLIDKPKKKTT